MPRLCGLFALDWAVAAGGAMVIINTVVFVKGEWGLGDSEVAWAFGAFAGFAGAAFGLPAVAAVLAAIAFLGTLAAFFLWPAADRSAVTGSSGAGQAGTLEDLLP